MPLSSFTIRDRQSRKQAIEVLFENEQLLVINKPPGLPVIPDHWDPEVLNLRDLVQQRYEKINGSSRQAIWTVHRIDADTSGLVVFARTKEMHRALSRFFEKEEVQKTYLAITLGSPDFEEEIIDLPLQPHPTRPQFMQVHKQGKPSVTRVKVLERFKNFSLLEVFPRTGRTHQIRVHLKEAGIPLAVDPLYGSQASLDLSQIKPRYFKKDEFEENRPLISRLTLHAAAIQFLDPLNNQPRAFRAGLPKDFSALLKALRRWNSL